MSTSDTVFAVLIVLNLASAGSAWLYARWEIRKARRDG